MRPSQRSRITVLIALLASAHSSLAGQSAPSAADSGQRPSFPAHALRRHADAVHQRYDALTDASTVHLQISSGGPLSLIVKPIVQLQFEARFGGRKPNSAPDSIAVTSRVFRLQVTRQDPSATAQPISVQQASTNSPGAQPPMLSFLVEAPSTASSTAWRTSVPSVPTASNQLVTADDTGIWFHGQRWLAVVANVIDLARQKGEMPLNLAARADTGRFSLGRLPARVKRALREGLRLTITEDVHQIVLPLDAVLHMANAPGDITSRFGALDFSIAGDDLDALRDFASRLAPVNGAVAPGRAVAQSTTAPATADTVAAPSPATQSTTPPATVASAAPTAPRPDSSAVVGITVGTEIALSSTIRECNDSAKLGDQFHATVSKALIGTNGFRVDSGAPVLLMVSAVKRGATEADPIHVRITSISISLAGRDYPLTGFVSKSFVVKEPGSTHHCIPVNGRLVLRLSKPFQAAQ